MDMPVTLIWSSHHVSKESFDNNVLLVMTIFTEILMGKKIYTSLKKSLKNWWGENVCTFAFAARELSLKKRGLSRFGSLGPVFELEHAQAGSLGTDMCCQKHMKRWAGKTNPKRGMQIIIVVYPHWANEQK